MAELETRQPSLSTSRTLIVDWILWVRKHFAILLPICFSLSSTKATTLGPAPLNATPNNPGDQKFNGVVVNGIKLTATDRARYNPVVTTINILLELKALHGDSLCFAVAHFDRLIGSPRVRDQILSGVSAGELTRDWDAQADAFKRSRTPYLLYQ